MSDNIETPIEATNHPQPATRPEEMTIQELRKLATSYGIKAQRDWDKEDFVMAINNRRNRHEALVQLVTNESSDTPAPGHARIIVHNTQTGSNHPIPVSVNNYVCRIPRDVMVDVPVEVLEALNNSKTPVQVKDPKGGLDREGKPKLVWKEIPSYPFQMIGYPTPGIARYPNGVRKVRPYNEAKHNLKLKYREIYGRWPRRAEYKKFQEKHMERQAEKFLDAEDLQLAKDSKDHS
jgi:hypothetical protein